MSSVMHDQIPSSLVKVIKKISNYRVNTVKLIPESSQSISPSQTMRIRLPTNVIVDFDSLGWHSKLTIATANSFVPPIEAFISQLKVNLGGETADSINNYGDLFISMCNINCSTPHTQNRFSTSLAPRPMLVCVDKVVADIGTPANYEAEAAINMTSATATQGQVVPRLIPAYVTMADPQYAVASTWLGLLSNLGCVDMLFLPQMEIEITLQNNNILAGGTLGGGASAGTWSLSDCFWSVDVIQFPQYTESILASLQAGQSISYEFTRWNSLTFGGGSASFDHKFSIASSNIQRVWWTYKKAAYTTQVGLAHGMHLPNYYVFTSQDTGLITKAVLYIDEKQYPNYTQEIQKYGLYEVLRGLGVHNSNQYDCLIESNFDYHTRKFIHCFNLAHKGAKPGEISGVNTMGLSSNIRLNLVCEDAAGASTALAAGGTFYVFTECKSILHILNTRIISVEH